MQRRRQDEGEPTGLMQIPKTATAGLLTSPMPGTVRVESGFWNPGEGGLCGLAVEQKFRLRLGTALW